MTTGRINQVAMLARRPLVLPFTLNVKPKAIQNSQGAFAYYPHATRFKIKSDMLIGEIVYQLLTVTLKFKVTHQSVTVCTEAQPIPL